MDLSQVEALHSQNALQKLTVSDLKQFIRSKAIQAPADAKKAQLIASVTDFLSATSNGASPKQTDGTNGTAEPSEKKDPSLSKGGAEEGNTLRKPSQGEAPVGSPRGERAEGVDGESARGNDGPVVETPSRRSSRSRKIAAVPKLEEVPGGKNENGGENSRPKRERRQQSSHRPLDSPAETPPPKRTRRQSAGTPLDSLTKKPPPMKIKPKSERARKTALRSTVEVTEVGSDVTLEVTEVKSDVIDGALVEKKKKKTFARGYGLKGDVGKLEISQSEESWTHLVHKKAEPDWIAYDPGTMRPPAPEGPYKKIVGWNVNGLRAVLRLERRWLQEIAEGEGADVICLQETKIQEKDVAAIEEGLLPGYHKFWATSSAKLGYSGVALFSKEKPLTVRYGLGIPSLDAEGRLITAEFADFFVVSGYIPNSGDGLKRLEERTTVWDPALAAHLKELEASKPVVLTGDLNVAHEEIDICNPDGNKRSAGFTVEERESFARLFLADGLVDTFRRQHPKAVGYTYWGYRTNARAGNRGWRLDYFLVSEKLAPLVHDSYTLPHVLGSDHCPVGLILRTGPQG